MSRIRIKNFGPVKEGNAENDSWIDIKKVTLFIGNQGSGKSTISKLYSTLSWIEKAIVKGVLAPGDLNTFKRFQRILRYQRIDHYLTKKSEIKYVGKAVDLEFDGNGITVSWLLSADYKMPKIMYVPAERNFLSVVDRPDKLKNLPLPLFTFLDEYDLARNLYSAGIDLPIGNVRFEFDKQNKLAHIVGTDNSYKLRLSEAASGFQSTIPLYLVTKLLAEGLGKGKDDSIKELSLEEQRKQDKIKSLIKSDKHLSQDQRNLRVKLLDGVTESFLNIVEEPEQNLFPVSQWELLKKLLGFNNTSTPNKLIMTTHSPYLIMYLTLAVKAFSILKKINKTNDKEALIDELAKIIPIAAATNPDDLVIYELDEEKGQIIKLGDYKGLPSDENYLNKMLSKANEQFSNLLRIEDKCRIS